jgi:SAM-dependent methyltransferase
VTSAPQAGSAADREFYDRYSESTDAQHEAFMREIEAYFLSYANLLERRLAGTTGVVVELGAGSCGLSACASRLRSARKVVAADISMVRIDSLLQRSVATLKGDISRINTIACDFNERLPFEDGSVDAILFDAALHHARSIWGLLAECRRIIKPAGVLIAQRESYLSPLRARRQLRALLQTPEVSAKVSENMYLREQYTYYLEVSGFAPSFHPFSPSRLKRLLRPLNGRLFSDGVLICDVRSN